MKDKVFIDTNLFLYLVDNSYAAKQAKARELIIINNDHDAVISFQVVQEFYNSCLRNSFLSLGDMTSFSKQVLFPIWDIYPSRDLYLKAVEVKERYQYSFYDSLIIAAALEGNCKTLYSEDLQNGQKIESLSIVNPF